MPNLDPIQTAFTSGVISDRARGRVDLPEMYSKALALGTNWMVLPQGPIRMRAGTRGDAFYAAEPKFFRFSSRELVGERRVAVTPGEVRVEEQVQTNLVTNGSFDGGTKGWAWTNATPENTTNFNSFGYAELLDDGAHFEQNANTIVGNAHTIRFRARVNGQDLPLVGQLTANGGAAAGVFDLTNAWQNFEMPFVAAANPSQIKFTAGLLAGGVTIQIRDVTVVDEMLIGDSLTAPWTAGQIPGLTFIFDARRGYGIFLHAEVPPYVLRYTPSVWQLYPAVFKSGADGASPTSYFPPEWKPGNYPSTGEFGFQGRVWYGGAPLNGEMVWGSKSGSHFDLRVGNNDDSAFSLIIDSKGDVAWMHALAELLVGTTEREHSMAGSNGLMTPQDKVVTIQSEFGSTNIPAVGVGEAVVYCGADKRTVRTIRYDNLRKSGWASRALTFFAEHITKGRVKELHYRPSDIPILLAVLESGEVVCCTIDLEENIVAWWPVNVGAPVSSAALLRTANGIEAHLAVERGTPFGMWAAEVLCMHEEGVAYLDYNYAEVANGAGTVEHLARFNGMVVSVITADEVVKVGHLVEGGEIALGADYAGAAVTVGLPFVATAKLLPLEGGNPAGTSAGFDVSYCEIALRLNNSVPPKINGVRPGGNDRPFAASDTELEHITGDVKRENIEVARGEIVIEQNLPFRTEVCAVYARAAISKV